jgi:hypothetical protein
LAIKKIDKLELFTSLRSPSLEGRPKPSFPMVALIKNNEVIAGIKFSKGKAWHVDNVTAHEKYGPTIYKVLMDLSGSAGIAPAFKRRKGMRDFVVPESKKIWQVFEQDPNVIASFLEDKYQENYLNKKFTSITLMQGIDEAKLNFRKKGRQEYLKTLGIFNKLKKIGRPKKFNLEYRRFIHQRQLIFGKQVHSFLQESVNAHQ